MYSWNKQTNWSNNLPNDWSRLNNVNTTPMLPNLPESLNLLHRIRTRNSWPLPGNSRGISPSSSLSSSVRGYFLESSFVRMTKRRVFTNKVITTEFTLVQIPWASIAAMRHQQKQSSLVQLNHIKAIHHAHLTTWAVTKTLVAFHDTGWFIGIPIMAIINLV